MPDEELARQLEFAGNALAARGDAARPLRDAGCAHAERTLAVAEATGQGQRLPVLFWTGTVRTMRGRLREAAEVLDTAIEIARVAGHEQGMVWNLFARAFAALAAGDNATALTAAREASRVMQTRRAQLPRDRRGPRARRRPARRRRRRPAPATSCSRRAARTCATSRRPGARARSSCSPASSSRSAAGAEPARAAASAQALAARLGTRPVAAMADRAAALVALAGAPPPPPGELAARRRRPRRPALAAPPRRPPPLAGPAHAATPRPPFRRRVRRRRRARRGRHLTRARRPRARRRGRDRARRRGARARRRRRSSAATPSATATPASASCGGSGGAAATGARRPVGDGSLVGSLTERELQIARLVVDRRTNAEIAAELYLSTKTVETHLRNLFHKLGVSSRVEVARVVERADAPLDAPTMHDA